MKTKIAIAITLMFVAITAGAEVYKCDKGGRSIYQAKPCDLGEPDSNKLHVKHQTAEEEAAAKAKLKEIEAHNTERKVKGEKAIRKGFENSPNTMMREGVEQRQQAVPPGREGSNPAMGVVPAYAPTR